MIDLVIFLCVILLTAGLFASFAGIEAIVILGIRWISGYIVIGALRVCVGIAIHCFGLYSFIAPVKVYKNLLEIMENALGKIDNS